MSGDARGGWLFLLAWMVPNIAAAVWAWNITEPPKNRGWAATKMFFVVAASILGFGIVHIGFWMMIFAYPFVRTFDHVDRYFGGEGTDLFRIDRP